MADISTSPPPNLALPHSAPCSPKHDLAEPRIPLTSNNVIDFSSTASASFSLIPIATESCSASPFTYFKPCTLLLPTSPVQKPKRLLIDSGATLVPQCSDSNDKCTFREDDSNCSGNLFYSDIVVHQASLVGRWAALAQLSHQKMPFPGKPINTLQD
ncbi:uncharacterized protein BJ212DRAFT_1577174 [Suillus subaureus]|uniref:Uncharacterized protein n=1 Tax=Suillus subaureus TaxID=48587 RepID=A0A9P7EA99_9AGAM|nr:uncharacterized protein BJ212DRAFT_1577174 [Suillus subaureus]KAG1815944.1 hypothetical protein BJ212DRAFT_1577174 [Suillus subaureus]